MSLRYQLYDYCNGNYDKLLDVIKCDRLRFRFNYALMFTAFEIKNDMERSVWFYEQLDVQVLRESSEFVLPWVSTDFRIDLESVQHFGN